MNRLLRDLRRLRRMNWLMLLGAALLLTLGVLFIFSACYVSEEMPVRSLYRKQMVWIAVGLGCYLAFAVYDYRQLTKWAAWFYAGGLGLLVIVLLIGSDDQGARRWLQVYGGVGIQPSEIAKLVTMIALAALLGRPLGEVRRVRFVFRALAIVLVPMMLVLREPDLGTAITFMPVAMVMMFVAGVRLRYLAGLAALAAVAVGVLLGAVFLPERLGADEDTQIRVVEAVGLREYHRRRVVAFFRPGTDPLKSGWNKVQSEIAVGSGGAVGKGFLKGTQNVLGYLPRSVAPTDFIYSVIAEEKGFAGSAGVLALFAVLLTFGVQAGLRAGDRFGRLLCTGVVSLVFCHVFINIAMTVGLLPITGLPLPLLSYGGSFMIVMMSALGIVQSVYIRAPRLRTGI